MAISFDRLTHAQTGNRYAGMITVVLEGESDEKVLKNKMFLNKKWRLQFRSVGSCEKDHHGSKAVIDFVRKQKQLGLLGFYGIVDRDSLFDHQKRPAWWETDDEAFANLRPFEDEEILVLHRWEIENYLLDCRALAEEVSNLDGSADRDHQDSVKNCALKFAHWLLPITATNLLIKEINHKLDKMAVIDGIKLIPAMHHKLGLQNLDQNTHEPNLEKGCLEYLREVIQKTKERGTSESEHAGQFDDYLVEKLNTLPENFREYLENVRRFWNCPADKEQKWERINRIIDGKEFSKMFRSHYNISRSPHEFNYALADRIRQKDYIDPWLQKRFSELQTKASEIFGS